jgi:hypothetical protein
MSSFLDDMLRNIGETEEQRLARDVELNNILAAQNAIPRPAHGNADGTAVSYQQGQHLPHQQAARAPTRANRGRARAPTRAARGRARAPTRAARGRARVAAAPSRARAEEEPSPIASFQERRQFFEAQAAKYHARDALEEEARSAGAAAAAAALVAEEEATLGPTRIVDMDIEIIYGPGKSLLGAATCVANAKPMWVRWVAFCRNKSRPPFTAGKGLGLVGARNKIDFPIMRDFIRFLIGTGETWNRVDCGCKFLQMHLMTEATQLPYGLYIALGVVNNDQVIVALRRGSHKEDSIKDIVNGADLQADLDNKITEPQMATLMKLAFLSQDEDILTTSLIARLNVTQGIARTSQMLQRSDDFLAETYGQRFIRTIDPIGPAGTEASMKVTKRGKTLKNGRKQYSAMIPHRNPLFSAIAWEGVVEMYRMSCLGEPFANHLYHKNFGKRPVFRSTTNYEKAMDSTTLGKVWKNFYEEADVVVSKVTHQKRRQGQQELYDAGVPREGIAQMAGYTLASGDLSAKQQECYITNPCAAAVVSRANGDSKNVAAHCVRWTLVEVPDELISINYPDILPMKEAVDAAYDACPSHEERVERRLCMARGSIHSIVFNIQMAFRMLASRPLDPVTGLLDRSAKPLYLQFRDGGRVEDTVLFRTPSFQSPLFMKLVEDVARAQEAEEDEQIVVDPQATNAFQVTINETVLPVLHALQQKQLHMQRQQQQLQQQLLQFMRPMAPPSYGGSTGSSFMGIGYGGGGSSMMRIMPQEASVPHQLSAAAAPNPAPNPLLLPQLPRPRGQDILVRPNKDGNTVRKRSKQLTRVQASELLRARDGETRVIMSNSNNTAQDYWNEYAHGRSGNPPLRLLEATKKEWRTDISGKSGSRQAWSQRVPIYNLIEFFIEKRDVPGSPGLGMDEDVALEAAQQIFESVPVSKKTGLRSLEKVSKEFKKELLKHKAWWKYGKGPSTDMEE